MLLQVIIGTYGDTTVIDAESKRRGLYADYDDDFPREARVSPSITATTFANLFEEHGCGNWIPIVAMDGNRTAIANQVWKYVVGGG